MAAILKNLSLLNADENTEGVIVIQGMLVRGIWKKIKEETPHPQRI